VSTLKRWTEDGIYKYESMPNGLYLSKLNAHGVIVDVNYDCVAWEDFKTIYSKNADYSGPNETNKKHMHENFIELYGPLPTYDRVLEKLITKKNTYNCIYYVDGYCKINDNDICKECENFEGRT
jgi:hypothetical protein